MGRHSLNSKDLKYIYCDIGNGSYDEYKDAAVKMAEKVGEKASELKDKAWDWLNSFS
jgi:hypothetical protein